MSVIFYNLYLYNNININTKGVYFMVDIVLIFLSMIIIGVSIIYSMRKNIKEKVYYDELQNINRSNAYKCSYIFLVFYFLLTVFLESIFKIQIFSNNNTMIITGILLSALIFAC